jgi:hypothetical protein
VSKLRTFFALSGPERSAFLEAWRWVCASRLRLFLSGLAPTLSAWRRPARAQAPWPAAARWIPVAGRYCPGGGNCLVGSLALFGLLRRAGVPAELRIGVGTLRPQLDAHAWVEVAGEPVNDAGDITARYAPFGELHALPGRP